MTTSTTKLYRQQTTTLYECDDHGRALSPIARRNGNNYGYFYDENGLRLRKITNGVATNYYYNGSVLIGMTAGSTTQKFSYDSSGSVVSVNYNGTEYYYLRNGQGDIVKLIDSAGSTVVEYKYDSWDKQLSCTGSLSTTLGQNQPFRYRGYVYDTETGWYYLQSRYYNPEVGRFISSDVLLSTGQCVLGHNAYAYCLNNPVKFTDSYGNSAKLAQNYLEGSELSAAVVKMRAIKIEEELDDPDLTNPKIVQVFLELILRSEAGVRQEARLGFSLAESAIVEQLQLLVDDERQMLFRRHSLNRFSRPTHPLPS